MDWISSDGDLVTAYRVERGESAGGPFAPVAFTGSDATSLSDIGLDANKTYYYRVIALNPTGESTPSPVQSATTRRGDLPAPQDVIAAELEDGRIRVTWSGEPANAQAEIQVSQGLQDGYVPLATVDAANGAYALLPAEDDVYVFRVKFVKGNAESPWTESTTVTFGGEDGPPTDLPQKIFLPIATKT